MENNTKKPIGELQGKNVLWFEEVGVEDVGLVGGKNSSLGEMYTNLVPKGVNVPNGFATTAQAYFYFLEKTGLAPQIDKILKDVNVHDLKSLQQKGKAVRQLILKATLPQDLQRDITEAYQKLSSTY